MNKPAIITIAEPKIISFSNFSLKTSTPIIETKKDLEKKEKVDKSKTVAETDREKLEKKFSKKKSEKLN